MVNMSQKTTDQKRFRRTRLKRAMKPLLEMFGCTQMEAAGNVERMLKENEQMKLKIKELEVLVKIQQETEQILNETIKSQKTKIKEYNAKGLGDALIQ